MFVSETAKAQIAFVITTIGAVATWAVTRFPDNQSVQLWGGLILAVLTILATTYGVYQTRNTPEVPVVPPATPMTPPAPPA